MGISVSEVALIAANRLQRERIHLLLIEDARKGLADISAGRTLDADVAIAKLQRDHLASAES